MFGGDFRVWLQNFGVWYLDLQVINSMTPPPLKSCDNKEIYFICTWHISNISVNIRGKIWYDIHQSVLYVWQFDSCVIGVIVFLSLRSSLFAYFKVMMLVVIEMWQLQDKLSNVHDSPDTSLTPCERGEASPDINRCKLTESAATSLQHGPGYSTHCRQQTHAAQNTVFTETGAGAGS